MCAMCVAGRGGRRFAYGWCVYGASSVLIASEAAVCVLCVAAMGRGGGCVYFFFILRFAIR